MSLELSKGYSAARSITYLSDPVLSSRVQDLPVQMEMSHNEVSDGLRRALHGALSMAQDRGYRVQSDNPLLKPPPTCCVTFFRSFPAYFDVINPVYGETIRFEFWNVPLNKLPGQAGQFVTRRLCRAARTMAVAESAMRFILMVPQYSHHLEKRAKHAVDRLGAQLEVFPHHFFLTVHNLLRQQPHKLLKDRLMLERLKEMYGPVANLPKVREDDLLCRYLGAGPGDVLLSGDGCNGMVSWRLVMPNRSPPHDPPGQLERRVERRRSDRAKFLGYLQTISEDTSYY